MKKCITLLTSFSFLLLGLGNSNFPSPTAQAVTYLKPSLKKVKNVKNNSFWYIEIGEKTESLEEELLCFHTVTEHTCEKHKSRQIEYEYNVKYYIKVTKKYIYVKTRESGTYFWGVQKHYKEKDYQKYSTLKDVTKKGIGVVFVKQSLTNALKKVLKEWLHYNDIKKRKDTYKYHELNPEISGGDTGPNGEIPYFIERLLNTYKEVGAKKISKKTYLKAKF